MTTIEAAVAKALAELPDAEQLVDASTVAQQAGVTRSAVYKLCERGTIPCVRIGSRWRFRPSELDEWMAGR